MAVGNISKDTVDKLAVGTKEHCLWDSRLKGFGVKVTPNGSKSYLVQYRTGGAGTPTRRVTIGKHGAPWTPAKARDEATKLLASVKEGIDPQERKTVKRREAVDLAFDKYAQHFLDQYGPRHWKAGTLADNRRYLTAKDAPAAAVLGRKPLPQIKRADIAAIFDDVGADKPGYARNLYSVLRKLFAWAVERGDIDRSPMEGFKGPRPVASRDRVLTDDELGHAWFAASSLQYPFGPLYRLLIATGQRREEVGSVDWQHLRRDAREWHLPSTKAKNAKANVVPLNSLALEMLDGIAGGDRWPLKGLVFTTTGKTPVSGFSKAKSLLDAEMLRLARDAANQAGHAAEDAEITPWRVHDLRRTFATGMQRLGVRFEVTEAILNHVSGARSGVAGVYQRHDWRDEKRTALDAWGRHVQSLQVSDTNNVVLFPASR